MRTFGHQVAVPFGAASVRVALAGFAGSDPATAGKATFSEVGPCDLDPASAGLYPPVLDTDPDGEEHSLLFI